MARGEDLTCSLLSQLWPEVPSLLVTGGMDRQGHPLADAWILDVEREDWQKVRHTMLL